MKRRIVALLALVFLAAPSLALAIGIHPTNKYSWGENIGWLNWGTPEGSVDIGLQEMSGYVWGENIGWISLNCSNTGSCATASYHVNYNLGVVSGYAWGENVGWISFSCSNTASCGTVNYGVTIDINTGIFSGYAWGENVGWVSMNCSNTSSCGTVDYKVAAAGPMPGAGGTGGGGGSPGGGGATPPPATPSGTPLPSATPTVSPSGTPSPTPTETVTPSPTVTPPVATPTGSPPPVTPTAPPPSFSPLPPPGAVVIIVDQIGQFIDSIVRVIFGENAPPPETAGAVAAAVVAIVPVIAAAVVVLTQAGVPAAATQGLVFFGLKRRTKVWGTVYDTRTKRPIPFAKIQLLDTSGRVLETRFTDSDGRYGFLTSPASLHEQKVTVHMVASHQGYQFPSRQAASGTDFIVYDHAYRGEALDIRTDSVLNFNIPLDPVGVSTQGRSLGFLNLTGPLVDRLLNLGFIIGLFLVPFNYFRFPTVTNLIVLIVFFAANGLRMVVMHRPYGVISDQNGQHLPFALVTLNDMTGARVAFAVSDEHGRYFLPAERGKEYTLTVYTPAQVQPPRSTSVRISAHSRTSRRAWVTLNVKV